MGVAPLSLCVLGRSGPKICTAAYPCRKPRPLKHLEAEMSPGHGIGVSRPARLDGQRDPRSHRRSRGYLRGAGRPSTPRWLNCGTRCTGGWCCPSGRRPSGGRSPRGCTYTEERRRRRRRVQPARQPHRRAGRGGVSDSALSRPAYLPDPGRGQSRDVIEAIEGPAHFFRCAELRQKNIFVEDPGVLSSSCPCLIKVVIEDAEELMRDALRAKSLLWLHDTAWEDFPADRKQAITAWSQSVTGGSH